MSGIIGNHEVAQAEGEVYTFGAYEVSLADWELRKHGVKIRLSRQGFRVLAELLEATGKVVTREHLCKTLWPDDTHVSFETNLNSIVHDVREALGDTAKNPRFIETVAGRGYRFLAPVRGAGGEPRAPTRRWLYVVLAGLGVAAVLWSVSLVVRKPAPSIQNAPRISPFTSFAGEEQHPSFSPDGERVAFSWNGSHHGASNIYIKSTGTEEVEQLTDSPAQDINPEWSPDGERIAWARAGSNYTADIMTVAVTGGSEIRIKTIPSSEPTLSWSPDGKWIAYSVAYPDYVRRDTAAAIFAVELETGRTVQLTEPGPRTIADLDPAISPDGRMLAFVRVTSWGAGDLYVAGLDRDLKVTDKPRRITFGGINAASPSWTPDSKEIIFTAPRAGLRVSGQYPSPAPPAMFPSPSAGVACRRHRFHRVAIGSCSRFPAPTPICGGSRSGNRVERPPPRCSLLIRRRVRELLRYHPTGPELLSPPTVRETTKSGSRTRTRLGNRG